MTSPGRLAEYLKTRRERLRPSDVGISVGVGVRRVAGLRREEVAVLAGISTDYYLRLEQGRDIHPSDQVLEALARALKLDAVAAEYLRSLARPSAGAAVDDTRDTVHASTQWLIDSWPMSAAVVHNRYIDVIASNSLARALNPNYRPGVNSVLSLFADPFERTFHADWAALAARSVSLLRAMASSQANDARLAALVAEGYGSSAMFREFWERHDVISVSDGTHELRHERVGDLTLQYQRLPLIGTEGHSIFIYYARPGTPDAIAIASLAASG